MKKPGKTQAVTAKRTIPHGRIFPLCGILLSFLLLAGCGKRDVPSVPEKADRTVLVYMAANNDLKYEALRSLGQMEEGYREEDGTLLVFVKTDRRSSHILRIREDNQPGILASDTLKTYAAENSSSADFTATVFADMMALAPSRVRGVVLWSHGTSWLPEQGQIAPLAFGHDRGRELDIKELGRVLPSGLDFLLFDACYMASIEVLYELRDKARHIIASSSEVLSGSYPYKEVMPHLFAGELEKACSAFYRHYARLSGMEQSCTVSLVDTEHLPELAATTKHCLENHGGRDRKHVFGNVQDFNFTKGIPVGFYDYLGFFEENFRSGDIGPLGRAFKKCVRYHVHTPRFLDTPIGRSSGITLSLPEQPGLVRYYQTLDWHAASGFEELLTVSH